MNIKEIIGHKEHCSIGHRVEDVVSKYSIVYRTSLFEDLNQSNEERNESNKIIERIFGKNIQDFQDYQKRNLVQINYLITAISRSEMGKPILEDIINGFEEVILPNWNNNYSLIFIGATIMNGIITNNQNPLDVIAQALYSSLYEQIEEKEKEKCLSFGLLIKEIYSSFSILMNDYDKFVEIPKLGQIYETYQKCGRFLNILFKKNNIIFDGNNDGKLKGFRRLRNAHSHLSIINSGNPFRRGKIIAIDRNSHGKFREIIENELLNHYRKELFYIVTFLSQIFTAYPFLVNKKKNTNEQDNENSDTNGTYMNFNSGTLYRVEKCLNCGADVPHYSAKMIKLPPISAINYEYDSLLEKKFSETHQLSKNGYFCDISCFKKYIKNNISKLFSEQLLNEFERKATNKKI